MRKSTFIFSLAVLGLSSPVLSKAVLGAPRVSKEAATRTALAAVPGGKIDTAELENEHHRLVWSFDIKVPGKSGVEEVQVSAVTGKVVAHEHESPAKQAAEKIIDPH
jgi:uncharacterized membrane protein YkoI